MYCFDCGGKIPDTANFCYHCGKQVRKIVKDEIQTTKKDIPTNFLLPSFFRFNAYNILGLTTDADQKMIQKRGKEIINRLKIDDLPEYDLDIDPVKEYRTDDGVKTAIQNLSSSKNSLKEFFFWFDFSNNPINQQLAAALKQQNNNVILLSWGYRPENNQIANWINQKNLAIYKTILLYNGKSKPFLTDSLDLWKRILNSDEFYEHFYNNYLEKLGFEKNSEFDKDFSNHIETFLSDIYMEISQKNNDPDYLNEFQKRFSGKGTRLEKDILLPILENIQKTIDELNKVTILKSKPSDVLVIQNIDAIFWNFQENMNKLISYGLYEDSRVKTFRDNFAEAIREIAIKINNEWDDSKQALILIRRVIPITGTVSLENKLKDDITQLEKLIDQKKITGVPISSAPTLYTVNGIGATLYGDTQYFVLIFIPIFPIARFSVERLDNNSYRFFGKLDLHSWQKIWQYLS